MNSAIASPSRAPLSQPLPKQPLPPDVRVFNGVGKILAALGLRIPRLQPNALIAAARRRTGLRDLGDDQQLREALALLASDLEHAARLTLTGRVFFHREIVHRLENRLLIEAAITADPGILEESVQAPIFIIGLARSGTTLLQRLLAEDPDNRSVLMWEQRRPARASNDAGGKIQSADDTRIADAARDLARLDRIAPTFKAIHELGAELPEECIGLMANDLVSKGFTLSCALPTYSQWLYDIDLRPTYRRHKRQLQLLQRGTPSRRWVLKAPFHMHAMAALLDVYDDARIIQTHRDPKVAAASSASLIATLRCTFSDHVSPQEVGKEAQQVLLDGLERAKRDREVLAKRPGFERRIADVHYNDLLADPLSTVRQVYRHFDMELSAEAERRMAAYLQANPYRKHGPHSYSRRQFGLES